MRNRYYEYRCPWCGERVTPPSERYFTVKRCEVCGNKYGFYWSAKQILWEAAAISACILCIKFMLHFLVEGKIFIAILFPILSFFTFPELYVKKPLKKIKGKNIPQTLICSEIRKVKFIIPMLRRYNFINNAIFPVCFINDQGQRASEYICVSLSQVKTDKNHIICFISELECGNKILDIYSEYTKIMIFVSKEIYFEGEVSRL